MLSRLGLSAKWVGGLFVLLLAIFLGTQSYYTTESGYNYIVENQWTGNLSVKNTPGVYRKVPFFTNIYQYKQVATINFAAKGQAGGNFTRNNGLIEVRFADSYDGFVPATFRYRLPAGEDEMIALHKEFRSFGNLVDALLVRNSMDVTIVTATQYAGEEFFLGGLNQYKVQLSDQLKNGLYRTVRKQVEIETTDVAAVSSEQNDAQKLEKQKQLVWKNVILHENGDSTKPALRLDNPLKRYGVSLTQVTVGNPKAEQTLEDLLDTKKALVGERIAAIQEIETARAQAKSQQQKLEIEKAKAIQIALKEKEVAVVAAQQTVEVERQAKRLAEVKVEKAKSVAVIQKQKELAVAQADRDIQQAAAEAAKFEAEAIMAKGLAKAKVKKAELAAKQDASDIYMAEMELEKARVMYPVLKEVRIDMPKFFMGQTPNGNAPTSLDVFTTLGAMEKLAGNQVSPFKK